MPVARGDTALVAQLDRASAFEAEGWGFESLRARQFLGPATRKPWACRILTNFARIAARKGMGFSAILPTLTFRPDEHPVKLAFLSALLLACLGASAAAEEMKPPRLSYAKVDWAEAVAALAGIDELKPLAIPLMSRAAHSMPRSLARLNNVMSPRFPGIATSPVPVLLPFDTAALLRDQAAGDRRRRRRPLFVRIPRHASSIRARPATTRRLRSSPPTSPNWPTTGSAIRSRCRFRAPRCFTSSTYRTRARASRCRRWRRNSPASAARSWSIICATRSSASASPTSCQSLCFDAGVPRFRMPTCRTADTIAVRFLRALQIAGGTPRQTPAAKPHGDRTARRASRTPSPTAAPAACLRDTGFRGNGGRADYTVYSQIRFPLAEAPAYAGSQMYRLRNAVPGTVPGYSYPWRDNFCERRGFPVGAVPGRHRPPRAGHPPGALQAAGRVGALRR